MITADGWFDWAARVPGPPDKVYTQPCTSEVYLPHDAVGYLQGWYSRLFCFDRRDDDPTRYTDYAAASVTGIVLDEIDPATGDAKLIQHYPISASCWGSGSRSINTRGNAFENERIRGDFANLVMPDHMVRTNLRIVRELAAFKGWTPRRPTDANDLTATCMEHNECTRFGSEPTACPSSRADAIWEALEGGDEMMWVRLNGQATWWANKQITIDGTMQLAPDFPALPADAKAVDIEVFLAPGSTGKLVFFDGDGKYAGQFNPSRMQGVVRVVPKDRTCKFTVVGSVVTQLVGVVGYLT